jgi:hypothetical protein
MLRREPAADPDDRPGDVREVKPRFPAHDGWLGVEFRNGSCGRHMIGPFGLGFSYNGGNDTLTDDFGITWYRFP